MIIVWNTKLEKRYTIILLFFIWLHRLRHEDSSIYAVWFIHLHLTLFSSFDLICIVTQIYRAILWTFSVPALFTAVSSTSANACAFQVRCDALTATFACYFTSSVYEFIKHFAGLRQVCPPWCLTLTHLLPAPVCWWRQLGLSNQCLTPHMPSLICCLPDLFS